MAEIRELLGLVDSGNYTCKGIKAITEQHLQSVREKIADLRQLEKTLEKLSKACEGGLAADYPIVDALQG
jgi:MerR family transcriptional regulator, mercuric resistance operon regulatory protein